MFATIGLDCERGAYMGKITLYGLIGAVIFASVSLILSFIIDGAINSNHLIGQSIGGFIVGGFILPYGQKILMKREKE